jgi:hypothetical protein
MDEPLSVREERLRVKAKEPRNYFDSGHSLSWSGVEGATEVAERQETADAIGAVADGAVADSTVVVGGASVEHGSWVECPNTFDRRLANIPTMDVTFCCNQSPIASPLSHVCRNQRALECSD